jgi:hypothetical protein
MKPSVKSKNTPVVAAGANPIVEYSEGQPPAFRTICDLLCGMIPKALPNSSAKIWHGSPVWFIDDNPVVGYNATAKAVNLLFWNGQAFDDPALKPVGKYRAAQVSFSDAAEIDPKVVLRWLKRAGSDIFDSKGFFKKLREGE